MKIFLWFILGAIFSGFIRPASLLALGYYCGYETQSIIQQVIH